MERWHHQDSRIANYKLTDLDDRTAHDLVVRALDVGVCPNRQIPLVLHEWRMPRHEEFQPRNVWSLFNAFTETLKGNLTELPRRTEALHGLLDNHVGLSAVSYTHLDVYKRQSMRRLNAPAPIPPASFSTERSLMSVTTALTTLLARMVITCSARTAFRFP